MKKRIAVILTLVIIIISAFPIAVNASQPLDEIQNYNIQIDMRNDGTMNIVYKIDWKVLDDSSQDPLEWVKIGIPNSHVNDIKSLSSNISKIDYYKDGGSYIRVDFDRAYHKGEIVSFSFSIHQSYMYRLDKNDNLCNYSFTPGWFDGIDVKSIKIRWNNADVVSSNSTSKSNGYLEWNYSLKAGEKLTAIVSYKLGTFKTNDNMQYVEENNNNQDNDDSDAAMGFMFFVCLAGIIVYFIIRYNSSYAGGFGSKRNGLRTNSYSGCVISPRCACVSSCACACACACAGGGRAGCSAKNLYGALIDTQKLHDAIQKK